MDIYRLPEEQASVPCRSRVVALGAFDGIHTGHRSVIMQAIVQGNGNGGVYTFAPGTLTVKSSTTITTREEQEAVLRTMGVTELFYADFGAVEQLSAEEFVRDVLQHTLHVRQVVCGFHYRFGKNGSGTADDLITLGKRYGIQVTVVSPVMADDTVVSSSGIRTALDAGDMLTVNHLLGRYYGWTLPVTAGQHLARKWGIPTVNQALPSDLHLPRFGVYASVIQTEIGFYTGVTNVGIRPTVGGNTPMAETHIDDFDGDLYGKSITVYPVSFLRDEMCFDSVETLRRQIEKDGDTAKSVFAPTGRIRAVFFDFDETFHFWSAAFDRAVADFLHRFFPNLPQEELASRRAEMNRAGGYGYRMIPHGYTAFLEHFSTRWTKKPVLSDITELTKWFQTRFADSCRLEPDVIPALLQLRSKGIRVGLITNGGAFLQNAKIDLSDSRRWMDSVSVSGVEGVHKPDPELFRRAALHIGVAPEDCLYVGDNPINDIQGSQNAGMKPLIIDRGFPTDHPSYETPVGDDVPKIVSLTPLTDWVNY